MPDYADITEYLQKRDARLGTIIREIGAFSMTGRHPDLGFLVGIIISQQLSTAAADTIITRFRALYPEDGITAERILETPDSVLRATGLSARKCDYIKDLSGKIRDNSLSLRKLQSKDNDTIRRELKQVKGIGDWTVDIYLMFGLVRLDVFPIGDLALRRAVATAYGTSPDDMTALLKVADNWRPYRSVGSWYLFRYRRQFLCA